MLKRSLIFIALMVAGLLFYSLWFGMNADKYDKTVLPYLHSTLPMLDSWQYPDFKPLLSAQAQAEFETEAGQAVYRRLSGLGKYKSIGKPQYSTDRSEFISGQGEVNIVSYTVPVVFETGPATIKLHLILQDGSYLIHHFRVNSGIFGSE